MSKNQLPLLLPIAAALGFYVYWVGIEGFDQSETKTEVSPATTQAAAGNSPQNTVANPLLNLKPEDFAETVDRPLFSTTRKPPPPPFIPAPTPEPVIAQPEPEPVPEPVVEEPAIDPSDFSLLAVSGSIDESVAVIRQASSDKIFHLRKGDQFAGLEVIEVSAKTVTIGKDDETHVISMFQSETPQESAEPVATDQAPQLNAEEEE